jgi:hypothetical protein
LGALAQFMSILKELKTIGQLLPSKEKEFYNQLSINQAEFKAFFENQKALFKDVCAFSLEKLDDEEIDVIFKAICPQNNAFILSKGDYTNLIDNLVQDYKKNQKKEQLKKLWKEKTDTDNPRAWSEKYKTPILALIPPAELPRAKKAFTCFVGVAVSDTEVQDAITYLSTAKFFESLLDEDARNNAFKVGVLKEYAEILTDYDAIRKYLLEYFLDVYDWFGDNMVEARIKAYAEHEYNTSKNEEVLDIIKGMSDTELKEYLIGIAQDNVLLGIQILKNKR